MPAASSRRGCTGVWAGPFVAHPSALQVDLSAGLTVNAGRKRAPIPIVDPQTGAKVGLPVVEGKPVSPVAIIDRSSGEQVPP